MGYSHEPSIAVVELASIARGIQTADAILKEATVTVLASRPVSPGRYVILFTGSVEDVRSALVAAIDCGADSVIDQLLLPGIDPSVFQALSRPLETPELDAVGAVETSTIAAAVEAADAAVKRGEVSLMELHLAQGIDGKSYFTCTGEVSDVEAAVAAASDVAMRRDRLLHQVIIPRPHDDLRSVLDGHHRPL